MSEKVQLTETAYGYKADYRELLSGKKTRVYCDLDYSNFPMERPKYSIKGEDPENDRLWVAYNRLELKLMREKIATAFEEAGIEGKLSFSRKAGCSCGCSAGFILDHLEQGLSSIYVR